MEFEILQEQLAKSLGLVSRAVGSRPQLPVLSSILLEAMGEGLSLSATDLELGIVTRVPAKVVQEGVAAVPAKTLFDFVNSLPPGKIEGRLEKEALVIATGQYRGKVQTIAAEEFPSLPKAVGKAMSEAEIGEFRRGVEAVAYAAAKDPLRPVLTGVLMVGGKSRLKLVATDGFRLSVASVKTGGGGWKEPILVPSRAMMEVAKLSEEGRLSIAVKKEASQVIFGLGETMVVSQLLSGNYPEYERIIPKKFEGVVEVAREELLSALRSVHIFAKDNSHVVKWVVTETGIELSAETPEKGEARAEVEGALEGEGGEIVFNAKYVLDYLQTAKAERVTLSISEALKPGVLNEVGNKNGLYVVMPVNA